MHQKVPVLSSMLRLPRHCMLRFCRHGATHHDHPGLTADSAAESRHSCATCCRPHVVRHGQVRRQRPVVLAKAEGLHVELQGAHRARDVKLLQRLWVHHAEQADLLQSAATHQTRMLSGCALRTAHSSLVCYAPQHSMAFGHSSLPGSANRTSAAARLYMQTKLITPDPGGEWGAQSAGTS